MKQGTRPVRGEQKVIRNTLIAFLGVQLVLTVVCPCRVGAESPVDIGIDEKLGSYVPMDLGFLDADGDSVYLHDVIDRPTILTLVYYHCPSVCKPLLVGVTDLIDKTDLEPGQDYTVLTISFDETDTPKSASDVRKNFITALDREVVDDAWRFLTGDSSTIAALTDAVGFRFRREGENFAHGTCLIALSPNGKVVRYLYGLQFMPFDLKMAVVEASEGRVAPSIARVLRYCFSYDPEGRTYVLNSTRIVGTSILILAIGWVFYISTIARLRRDKSKGSKWATQ